MQDQGWRLDQREDGAYIGLQERPQERLHHSWAGPGALILGEPPAKSHVVGPAWHVGGGHRLSPPELVDLGQDRLGNLCGHPDWIVVGGHAPGRGVGQDERAGSCWSGGGKEQRRGTGVQRRQQRRLLGADLVQDHGQLLGIRFPRRKGIGRERIGGARAGSVEEDQSRERRQRPVEQGQPGVLPGNVDVAEAGCGHDQIRWPLPEHLVGDPVPSQLGVPGLGLHRCLHLGSADDGILSRQRQEGPALSESCALAQEHLSHRRVGSRFHAYHRDLCRGGPVAYSSRRLPTLRSWVASAHWFPFGWDRRDGLSGSPQATAGVQRV